MQHVKMSLQDPRVIIYQAPLYDQESLIQPSVIHLTPRAEQGSQTGGHFPWPNENVFALLIIWWLGLKTALR